MGSDASVPLSMPRRPCLICGSEATRSLRSPIAGYVTGTSFDVHRCDDCRSHFVDPPPSTSGIYELIYRGGSGVPGYERYARYAEDVLTVASPLDYLARRESAYFAVRYHLRSLPSALDILEVGSGFGYLTYALRKEGHRSFGIDPSRRAVASATARFGNLFTAATLEDLAPSAHGSFDVILATEVIEHTSDPSLFLRQARLLLREGGAVLVTTPNKDYSRNKAIWQTDVAPVHTCWLGRDSLRALAIRSACEIRFLNLSRIVRIEENRLLHFLKRFSQASWVGPVVGPDGSLFVDRPLGTLTGRVKGTLRLVADQPLVCYGCNLAHSVAYPEHHRLAAVLTPRCRSENNSGPQV